MQTRSSQSSRPGSSGSSALAPPVLRGSVVAAMTLLAESHTLAHDAGCDPWDFAVEIHELDHAGVSRSGLRWMLSRNLALHAHETTPRRAKRRSFDTSGAAVFLRHSCFVASEAGLALWNKNGTVVETLPFERFNPGAGISSYHKELRTLHGRDVIVPHYDPMRAELTVRGQVVKRYRRAAMNQQAVILAFAEAGWIQRIDDPLPATSGICAKRRLQETVKALNSHHLRPLLRFSGDGTGEGVRWDFVGTPMGLAH